MENDDQTVGEQAVAPEAVEPEEMSTFDRVVDGFQGVNNGMEKAVTGLVGNIDKVSTFINDTLNIPNIANIDADGDGEKDGWDVYSRENYNRIVEENDLDVKDPFKTVANLNFIEEPETVGGNFISEASKFLTGFALTGPLFKSLGIVDDAAGGLVASMKTGAGKGLVVDTAIYDQTEDNLAAFIKENEWAEGPIIDFLATDETDSASVNMLKRGLEGMAFGGAIDVTLAGAVAAARAIKATKNNVKNGAELTEAQVKEVQAAEDISAQVRSYDPDASVAPRAAEPAPSVPTEIQAGPKATAVPDAPAAPTFADLVPEVGDAPVQKGAITRLSKSPVPHIDSELLRKRVLEASKRTPKEVDLAAKKLDLVKLDIPVNPKFYENRTADVIVQEMHDIMRDEGVYKAIGLDSPQTHDAVTATANKFLTDAFGAKKDIQGFSKNLALAAKMTEQQAAMVVAGKAAVEGLAKTLKDKSALIARKADAGVTDEALELELIRDSELMMEIFASTKGLQTAGARATSAGKIVSGDLDTTAVDTFSQLGKMKGSANIQDVARKIAALEDPLVIARTLTDSMADNKFVGILNEVFINNILSGYRTFMINIKGNAIHNLALPVERMMGGAGMKVHGMLKGDNALKQSGSDEFFEGLYHYQYARTHAMQSLRMAAKSFKQGTTILDNTLQNDLAQRGRQFTKPSDDYVSRNPMMGTILQGVGVAIRSPTERMLAPSDEFFKQFTFRNRANAILAVEAHKLSPADLKAQGFDDASEWIAAKMANTVHTRSTLEAKYKRLVTEGRVVDDVEVMKEYMQKNIGKANLEDKVAARALREAQIGTGTAPLAKGTVGHSIQKVLSNHPLGRQFIPFIQTPMNLLTYGLKRFPMAQFASKKLREELYSDNPDVAAEAYGRVMTSGMIATAAIMLHAEGKLTGGGPADWQKRKQAQAGPSFQPYSFRAGDTWVAYNRDDPIFTPLGMIADMIEATEYVQFMSEDGGGLLGSNFNPQIDPEFVPALMMSIANNVTSKSYLQSIVDLTDIVSSKDSRELGKFMKTRAGAMVPLSGLGGNINGKIDPYQRELQTVMDHVWSKVPAMTGGLPVKYDWLSGQALIKPKYFMGTMVKNVGGKDRKWVEVDAEMSALGAKFQGTPRTVSGLKLDPKSRQVVNRNMGNFKTRDGKYLIDALHHRMQQDDYKAMGPYKFHDAAEDPRIKALGAIIQQYREYAVNVFKEQNSGLFFGEDSYAAQYNKYLVTGDEQDRVQNDLNKLDRDFLDTLRK